MFSNLPHSAQPLVASYNSIRRAVGVSGLLLPVILGPFGWLLFGVEIQDNISSYYHTPLRDIFVGTLCAMGVFLFCYRGHDWIENWTANLGCVFAFGVALFPLDEGSDPLIQKSIVGYLHTFFGAAFFLTLAFYSLFHFPGSNSSEDFQLHEKQRDFVYRASGVTILLALLASAVYMFLLPKPWKEQCNRFNLLFWLEWIAVWSFAAAWLTKGRVIIADVAIDLFAHVQEKFGDRLHMSESNETRTQLLGSRPWRFFAAVVLTILGLLCLTMTALPFFSTGWWVVRCCDFPRLQLAMLLSGTLAGLLFVRQSIAPKILVPFLTLIGVAAVFQWAHVTHFTPIWPTEIASRNAAGSSDAATAVANPNQEPFSVLTVNVKFENERYEQVADEIEDLDPQVLVLIEVTEPWREGLKSLERKYPYREDVILDKGRGLCLWSQFPLESPETKFLVEEDRPSIWARFQIDANEVNVVAVHPPPPGLKIEHTSERRDSRVRDAELVLVAKEIARRQQENWIVAGDFNDVAWSHTTRLFKRLSGMKDPRVGRSFMGTYHASLPLLRFPIDHVFLSDGFRVHSIDRHAISGSDHFAMSARVVLAQSQAGTTPEPAGDDLEEADEIVREGAADAAETPESKP